jgi:hypothetical protein
MCPIVGPVTLLMQDKAHNLNFLFYSYGIELGYFT